MSDLTTELNLVLAVDDDDLADYLDAPTNSLRSSLLTIDGLFSSATGHAHNGAHQGGSLGPNSVGTAQLQDGAVTQPKLGAQAVGTNQLQDAGVTYAKLAANIIEALFTGVTIHQTAAYTVVAASPIMWVFCDAAITVTLTAGINRPVTIWAVTGNTTVATTGGTVIGGSLNTSTGAVENGVVSQGDAYTYKWDGANWRAT